MDRKKVKEKEKGSQAEGKETIAQSNGDPKSNVHSIWKEDKLFGNWWEHKWCPKFSHHDAPPLTHASQLQ